MAQDFKSVGEAFVQHYYQVFDSNRAGLATLYKDQSLLTFEGQQFMGTQNIVEKLKGLSFEKVEHVITTCDCQPVPAYQPNGILVFVSGTLRMDQNNPMTFSQCFHLMPDGASFWVLNDMFRLNLA